MDLTLISILDYVRPAGGKSCKESSVKNNIFGILPLVATASLANAVPVAKSCNGCSESQVLNFAATLGGGQHYVYNISGAAVYLVSVQCEPNGQGGTTCYPGDEVAVPSGVTTAFNKYHSLYVAFNYSEKFNDTVTVNLPGQGTVHADGTPTDDGRINAYDTLFFSALENQVLNYLNSPANYSNIDANIVDFLQNFDSKVINFQNMSSMFQVKFNDGSVRNYKWNHATGTFEPIPNTARDAHGNLIPESAPGKSTGYLFGDTAHHYDYANIYWDLMHRSASPPYCIQTDWAPVTQPDGTITWTLTCVRTN